MYTFKNLILAAVCFGTWAFVFPLYGFTTEDSLVSQKKQKTRSTKPKSGTTMYGTASYYASKFQGRKTATGAIFDHKKMTAACNVLPLGTWLRITNLKNFKTAIVQTNDRLHAKSSRLVDLTSTAANKLGFYKSGLARVKIEVLPGKPK